MKAVKKFERGGYKFTATLNEDYTCEVVSDDISVEDGGFISNWSMIPLPTMLNNSIDQWIESMERYSLEQEGKTKDEIEFILSSRRHGFEIINLKK
jgi:hypothetical protein